MSSNEQELSGCAPLLVSVYHRLDHLKNCIASLKNCVDSDKTILYVVSDAAYREEDRSVVDSIRRFVSEIAGFQNVSLIARESNFGSFKSINTAIDYVIKRHGRVIFLEDDNIVSPNFLLYMNEALNLYRDDTSIFSISGYNFPVTMPQDYPYDIYRWQGYSAWGVGLWQDKWFDVDWSRESIERALADKMLVRRLNRLGEHVLLYLTEGLKKNNEIVADAAISIHLAKHNLFSVFPVLSKVKNMGHDGTGEHGGVNSFFVSQKIDPGLPCKMVLPTGTDPAIFKVLRIHFKTPFLTKVAGSIPGPIKRVIKKIL